MFHDLVADMDAPKNATLTHDFNNNLNVCLTGIVLMIWAVVLYISYSEFNDVLRLVAMFIDLTSNLTKFSFESHVVDDGADRFKKFKVVLQYVNEIERGP